MLRTRYITPLALVVGLAIPAGALHASPASAWSCTKARIGGATKCLARGQFCKASYASQYKRYGFRCVSGRLR